MPSPDLIRRVLNRLRPLLQADGGDLELVAFDEQHVVVRLTGACATCPQAHMTLHCGLEAALRDHMPGLRLERAHSAR